MCSNFCDTSQNRDMFERNALTIPCEQDLTAWFDHQAVAQVDAQLAELAEYWRRFGPLSQGGGGVTVEQALREAYQAGWHARSASVWDASETEDEAVERLAREVTG